MGLWLELRCDKMTSPQCYSGKNTGPMGMTAPTHAGVQQGLQRLMARGRKDGWVRRKGGGVLCPACQKEAPGDMA